MHIAIYAFDGVSSFHLAAPQLVFGEVRRVSPRTPWTTTLWSFTENAVTLAEGYRLSGLSGPDAAATADIVVVPSWPEDLPELDARLDELLTAAHARGATIVGLCLGAVAVADSGLLAGRTAVTHWAAMEALKSRHSDIDLDSLVLYVDHGDVMTSAGTVSAVDACLHLVRERLGADVANDVARSLVVAPHRDGGQAQYTRRPVPTTAADNPIGDVIAWALGHLDESLTVERLAAHACMSTRSFVRNFKIATGATPAQWVLTQRLDAARVLLETTDLAVDTIARRCGFGSSVTMRQNFATAFATSPARYRQQFRRT
ncbi:Transcriptional regulator containing an amidase domain and an AraC-type DNA-binding HTH domain [Gordonia terrae C-6]|uniref:Transcriptional regulator containing an amidase domain and an AraC-type DNA-binding HTH domain n=1 Tax=Gordonia terrae C-6 TaxID=1316928 RepID=R7Y9W0_9ACTN|nr:helix-turn-helix domain-containing protein [Gordonia terrae]EON32816.1 Transcriptional regulator containing an amidase domain and an AraC-type DNA-binding HTH domain [Gordonia terrae C-6]